MASINVSEADFAAVACAACDAQDRGDMQAANDLDKIARKINAALTNASVTQMVTRHGFARTTNSPTWRDMPSTLTGK